MDLLLKYFLALATFFESQYFRGNFSKKPPYPQKRKRAYLAGSFLFLLGVWGYTVQPVRAEGSKELTSNGGNRAFLLYHSNANSRPTIGSIPLRTTIKAYVNAGETINLGSSAAGIGSGVINYRSPIGTTGSCPAPGAGNIGKILNRTQEVAGPLPNSGGYSPCIITSAETLAAGSGIWEIDFVSPNPAVDNNPTGLSASASWTQASNVGWVAAWDVTVRNSSGTAIPGRVYSNSLALRMPPSGASFSPLLRVVTRDGYQYLVNPRNLDPFTFVFFSNNNGFKSSATNVPLYRSVLFPGGTGLEAGVSVHDPNAADIGNNVTNKVFFNSPNPDLPSSAISASGTTWLIQNPIPPTPTNFQFTGVEGTVGQAGTSPLGGNFNFNSNVTGRFFITLDLNRDGIYGNSNDRILSGLASFGSNTIYWDGKDAAGVVVAAGLIPYGSTIQLYAGEIHFPLLDAEGNPGGITIQRLNNPVPSTNPNPDPYGVYFNNTSIGGSSAVNGVNSSGGANSWTSSFGDNKGIDTWTYYPSQSLELVNGVTIRQADLAITKTDNRTTIPAGSQTTYTITVTNNGPNNITGAQVIDTIPATLTNVTWTCAITTGTGACGAASGSGNSMNTTVDLNNGAVATYTVTAIVSPTASGTIANTAQVLRSNDVTDPTDINKTGAGNNSATDTTTITVPTTYNISGTLYEDTDGGNDLDATEPKLPANITVKLLDSTGTTTIQTTTTNASGQYTFTGVTNGNYKIQVDTSDTDIPAGFTLGTPNDLAVTVSGSSLTNQNFGFDKPVSSNPNVLLVKRITAINESSFTDLIDGVDNSNSPNYVPTPHDTDDNNPKWRSNYLQGLINGGTVRPNDEVEYTVYFLSAGDATAPKVLMCDRIPNNVSFIPTAFNSFPSKNSTGLQNTDRGILWQYNGYIESLSNIKDGDFAQYFPPGEDPKTVYPSVNCSGANTNGAIVVNLRDLPNATAPGTPTNSYGFIRFWGRVK
ncbi:MAG: SdrD B-like domain-containing protein [Nostochopsis sp.]